MAARSFVSTVFVLAAIGLSTASVTACGRHREPLYASTVVVGDAVLVRVNHAYVRGDKVVVKTFMENRTDQPVTIDRDSIALRLTDGSVIPRASGRSTRHEPYHLAPGEGRDVNVDFRLHGRAADISEAFLVIDGVEVGADKPRMLGEVALSSRYAIRRNVAQISATEAAAAKEASEAEEAGEAEADAGEEPAAETEAEPSADEAGEAWEIGN